MFFSLIILSCGKKEINEEYFPESSLTASQKFLDTSEFYEFEKSASENLNRIPEIYVQMGHIAGSFSYTNAVCFTNDGKYVLSGNGDATIKLWNTETGREVRTFRCADDINDLDISASGRYAVSGDMNFSSNINVWDIFTGKTIKTFSMNIFSAATPVVFCNNDKNILCGGDEERLKLWDMESGENIREFHTESTDSLIRPFISCMALSPDGKRVVTGSRYNGKDINNEDITSVDNTIRVWDIDSGEELLAFNKGNGWVETLGITPDGKYILSGDWQQDSVRVWELETGKQINAFNTNGTSAIAISAGGRYALFGGCLKFSLWDLSTGKEIRKIDKDITGWIKSIKFSPDGKYALVGDQSAQPKLWDLATGQLEREFGGFSDQTGTVKLSETGNFLLTAHNYNNRFTIWDYRNGNLIKTIPNDSNSILTSATINKDGSLAITSGWEQLARTSNVIFWDLSKSKQIKQSKLNEEIGYHARSLTLSEDEKQLLWTSGSDAIFTDVETGHEIKRFSGIGTAEIMAAGMSANGRYFFIDDRINLKVVDFKTGEIVRNYENCQGFFNKEHTKLYLLKAKFEENVISLETLDLTTLREENIQKVKYIRMDNIAAGRDSDYMLFSDQMNIYKINLKNGKVTETFAGHSNYISNIEASSDGKYVCSSSLDGTTRLWDIESGKEIVQFISFTDGEWIVITPEGYFNASPNGARHLNVRVGNEVYSVDNFYEKFYNPAFVASVLQASELQGTKVEPVADIRKGIALPPKIKIISPETNSELKTEEITLTISASDMGGGIDEIRLYHNSKVVSVATRGMKQVSKGNESSKSYTVTLVDGVNLFKATGFSKDRTESNPAEILVRLIASPKDVSMHVFTVGINKYENPALNLNYAEPDAKGIAQFFRQSGKGLFKRVDVMDIYNEQATREEILSRLKRLENTNPQDAVLIYLAGHGENINEKWYFIPHELTYPEKEEDVKSKAISSDELSILIKNIKAQKILVLIDACKSGAALIAFRGFEDRKALAQLSRATGVHIVAASSKDQFATEVKELGHGIFTYTLLEGLRGKAAAKGETVTARKLMSYIEEHLPELTKKYKQEAQYPVVDSKGMDFPLVSGN